MNRNAVGFVSLLLAISLLTVVSSAVATPLPFRGALTSVSPELTRHSPSEVVSTRKLLTLNVRTKLLGNVHITLPRRKLSRAHARVEAAEGRLELESHETALLQGTARVRLRGSTSKPRKARHGLVPVAASVVQSRGDRALRINFSVAQNSRRSARFFRIESPSPAGTQRGEVRVRSVPSTALHGRTCALGHDLSSPSHASAPRVGRFSASAATLKVVELATDCDVQCANLLGGSNANSQIRDFVNSMDAIYRDQLGITFDVVNQIRRTSTSSYPSGVTDSATLLDYVFDNRASLGRADIKHLVTGRTMDDGVIGLAYVGSVCMPFGNLERGAYGVGLSQHFNSLLTHVVMSHEIGHNFNANHTSSGIMQASLGGQIPTQFSPTSVAAISSFISSTGVPCLSNRNSGSSSSSNSSSGSRSPGGGGGGGTTTGVTFSTRFKSGQFTANVAVAANYAQCTAHLYGGRTRRALQRNPVFLGTGTIANSSAGIQFLATGLRTVRLPRTGRAVKVFIQPRLSCETGGAIEALPRGLRISSKRAPRRTLSNSNAWLTALAGKL